eukprot:CAMPEP_0172599872 /NCGR_PEP_ID=MMETSP1068-20121228/20006_1 /TAXON_ID=35684 /ORGANISM="Pseudopedinella elastica, Strain CCMP716" /LENGTH=153 /DNA_ID=CAMNT_0013400277 /DNA_START=46 /DNA_END=504 /DNA_ORIENTATION=+
MSNPKQTAGTMSFAAPAPRVVSLRHVKEPTAEPKPPEKKRIAWSGGKITTNKEEATLRFLQKKKERGDTLTKDQEAIISKFTLKCNDASSEELLQKLESTIGAKQPVQQPPVMKPGKRASQGTSGGRKKPRFVMTTEGWVTNQKRGPTAAGRA